MRWGKSKSTFVQSFNSILSNNYSITVQVETKQKKELEWKK